jgi:hypothetical protein
MIGNVACSFAAAQLAADIEAAQTGQHDIEQNQVGQQRLCLAQSFLAVVGDDRLVAFALQVVFQHVGQTALVLDDEDAQARRRGRRSVGRGGRHRGFSPDSHPNRPVM